MGWVGIEQEQRFLQFDTETGELTGVEAPTPGISPHAAAIDREGWLWATYWRGNIGRFDTANPEDSFETVLVGVAAEKVIIDENDVPWIGWNHDLLYYDRAAETGSPRTPSRMPLPRAPPRRFVSVPWRPGTLIPSGSGISPTEATLAVPLPRSTASGAVGGRV